ncbi:MAG TPA: hypothetical protein VGJ27_02430 [Gaiellaceae bacterium]
MPSQLHPASWVPLGWWPPAVHFHPAPTIANAITMPITTQKRIFLVI